MRQVKLGKKLSKRLKAYIETADAYQYQIKLMSNDVQKLRMKIWEITAKELGVPTSKIIFETDLNPRKCKRLTATVDDQ